MIADEMRAQAAAWQKQAELVQRLEEVHAAFVKADRDRDAAIDRALAQGVPPKFVAEAVQMPVSTVRSRMSVSETQREPEPPVEPDGAAA